MRVAIACDHAGFYLKQVILEYVKNLGYEVSDLGTMDTTPVDFPDFVEKAAKAVQSGDVDRGIVICGSGVGACIAANKINGVYASLSHDTYSAHQGVEHDNANVLCLGARIIGVELAKEIVQAFLAARFLEGDERFIRRFKKVQAIEANQ
ncbi:MAG: ribose 5-phosphate isomerase B [Bellilinea sp.]